MDAEKLCQLTQSIPKTQRQMFAVSIIAYLNGMEAGAMLKIAGLEQVV